MSRSRFGDLGGLHWQVSERSFLCPSSGPLRFAISLHCCAEYPCQGMGVESRLDAEADRSNITVLTSELDPSWPVVPPRSKLAGMQPTSMLKGPKLASSGRDMAFIRHTPQFGRRPIK